ncbi:MAG TPA: phage protease, partial [Acidobacteriota bacterium]|nr:phage protease [Acidobacteriota bacterium]
VDAAAQDEEAEMLEKLRTLLGLSADATEEEVGAAAEAAVGAGTELAELDKTLLEIDPALGEIDQKARLAALKLIKAAPAEKEPDPEAGTTDPEKGTAGMGADAAEVLVEAAVAAGKVPPKGEAREKLAKALATLSIADAKEVLGLVGATVPKGGDLKGKADGGADGAAPGLRETMRKNLGLSREAMEKFAPDKVTTN